MAAPDLAPCAKAGAPALSLHRVEPSDYQELSRFLVGFGLRRPAAYWAARLAFYLDDNPFIVPGWTRGYTLKDGAGRIRGVRLCIPRRARINGREVTGYAGGCWYVDPQCRSQGSLRLFAAPAKEHRGAIAWSTTMNPSSSAAAEAFGYTLYTGIPRTLYLAGCLGFHAPLLDREAPRSAHVLFCKVLERGKPFLYGGYFVPPSKPAQAIRGSSRPAVFFRDGSLTVSQVDRAGREFDDLWSGTSQQFALTSVRSAAAVNWACFGFRWSAKKLLGCYENGTLAGFAVLYRRRQGQWECVDWWQDFGRTDVASALLQGVKRCFLAARSPLAVLELPIYHPVIGDAADASLPRAAESECLIRTYYRAGEHLAPEMPAGNIYLTGMEGDRYL